MSDNLEIKAAIQIRRTPGEVFEAIVNPVKMSNYFISNGSARMEAGKVINWKFPEFDIEFPIRVGEIVENQYISYHWEIDQLDLLVEINLIPAGNSETLVKVTEKSRTNDEAGIKWLGQNTEGWANFLACLKCYLEYGINLRKGAFDYMKNSR